MQCERIRQARNHNKMTQESLGKRIGVSKATISQWESGTTEPNGKNLVSLAKALGVTIEWLLDGDEKNAEVNAQLANAKIIGNFAPWDSNTPLGEDEIELPFFKEISLSAGKGSFVTLDNNGYKLRFAYSTLRKAGVDPANAACVSITGNSMEPVVPDGATAGIDRSDTNIKDGQMYAIEHEGMLRVKILYRIPGGIRIRSYNRDEYADEDYIGSDISNIKIMGKVFWYSVLL
ncbi:helix-turn-helix transcriptional regulator [Arsenophonus nasoniae]|uniref:HTH-type transcriptional regulator PrtR n=1 Tax=Arsenophonus nasoniae TaxID=638 RepID=D2U0V0_9GAMM|nr:helix-turn-helix transcriptional regulator [Arsenophonus nasoniae]QBY43515.1 HTH-type transcriptional regulator PrtR [Arsenophonus nasoniae]WGM02420.1 helix-turn-helix transcriptional regulator [Arsenophonus nasoniae]WGM07483.1 helix-turn-helix transcriptional regulator [Arsenophonus nasoniae]WGM12339.1 helix-turn-helix transcriptional regulator [Arsenophonus nasoniae]WGM17018.1 helix-turn-helix transcriptional regulator [Arsenophonus nasoniae]